MDRAHRARRPDSSGRLSRSAARVPATSAVRIAVRLTPRAGVDTIDGVVDGGLQARVAPAPSGGAANEALIRLIAEALGLARSRVSIVGGATSRRKLIEIDGIEPAELRSRWPGLTV